MISTLPKYLKSKYNIFVPYDNGETIIFNSLTGAIGKFDKDTFSRFSRNELSELEIKTLSQKGILITDGFDETKKINEDRLSGINNNAIKHLRVWPTSACNANCYYCFEKGLKPITMRKKTADHIVRFVNNELKEGDTLRLEWFGGEPLLNVEIIDYLVSKLKKICDNKKSILYSSMISNGSLINQELAKKMKQDWGIRLVQITLDGFDKDYNNIKNFCNSNLYNFDKTINAIKYLANEGLHVTIRMNYDTKNYESLIKLINFLHVEMKEYANISYYVYPVWSSIDEKVENSFSSQTKADLNLLQLFDLLVKNNMCSAQKLAGLNYKRHACQAWGRNSFTVLPDGKIAKCAETFNFIIGNIQQGITDLPAYEYWTNGKLDFECESCVYLPICQGGCKASHFNSMPHCFALKPIFNEVLKWYVHYLDREHTKDPFC